MHTLTNFLMVALVVGGLAVVQAVRRSRRPKRALRRAVGGLAGFNGLSALACAGLMMLSLSSPTVVLADQGAAGVAGGGDSSAWAAALATGLACIGAGIAVAIAGAAAIGGITEKPETFGRALIFVGLAEGIAIYGLIIAFMILNR